VYRAKVYGVAGFERLFAVKRFHPAFVQDSDAAAKLATAARLYGSLEHPRVARLHEFGVTGGETFAATEFVEGLDLARLMDGGTIAAGAAARLVVQIGRAVGYAHGRGLSHLGICPTNLICNSAGEIKVTDFGFLAPRLPADPVSDPSLAARIPYLAPEQLAGEPTSPATDVYQLGLVAYELWVGRKPFKGASAADIARKILDSVVPDPGLDKAYTKLLKRALARSPFERFPDTGAMADALEAALRSTPLPGDLRDVGEAVRKRLEALDERSRSEASGAVSFPMPAAPVSSIAKPVEPNPRETITGTGKAVLPDSPKYPTLKGLSTGPGPKPGAVRSTLAGVSGDSKAPGGTPLGQIPVIKKPISVAKDVAPATIRMDEPLKAVAESIDLGPAGADDGARPGQFLGGGKPTDNDAETAIRETTDEEVARRFADAGASDVDDEWTVAQDVEVPSTLPPSNMGQALNIAAPGNEPIDEQPTVTRSPGASGEEEPSGIIELDLEPDPDSVVQPMPAAPAPAPIPHGMPQAAAPGRGPMPGGVPMGGPMPGGVPMGGPMPGAVPMGAPMPGGVPMGAPMPGSGMPMQPGPATPMAPQPSQVAQGTPSPLQPEEVPPPAAPPFPMNPSGPNPMPMPQLQTMPVRQPQQTRPRWPLYVVLFVGVATCSFLAYNLIVNDDGSGTAARAQNGGEAAKPESDKPEPKVPVEPGKPEPKVPVEPGKPEPKVSAEPTGPSKPEPKAAAADAGIQAGVGTDAGSTEPPPAADKLVIDSNPSDAKIYLDGTLVGRAPQTLDPSPDKHQLAIVAPGYKLYKGEIDGSGIFKIDLVEVSPPDGPAGIKVRCKKKNRYYVFVDGIDVGQLCPTERIGVEKGAHVVEIYDPISDSRRAFNVVVKQTRHSLRVRVD
jgi:serine/threonine protein kinase